MHDTHLREAIAHHTRVWNALISKRATRIEITSEGVSYIHATKGRRFVSAKRFAANGAPLNV